MGIGGWRKNLFIVRYYIGEAYRLGRELVVASIDFEKAFDSVADAEQGLETDIGVPGYTLVAALQGEIGASTVRGRDMKIKITFAQYMFRTRNGLLEGMFRKMLDEIRPKGWMKQLGKYMVGVRNKSFTLEDYKLGEGIWGG